MLYVCVHNAGRSQMAEALTNARARERSLPVRAQSAGTVGGKTLNPMAVAVLEEIGVDLTSHAPKLLTPEQVAWADRIISMGCGVDAAACPTRFLVTEDWELEDPAGQPLEFVRAVRDQIRARIDALLDGVIAESGVK